MKVEFDELVPSSTPQRSFATRGGIIGWIIKSGLAKTESQANMIMILVILASILISAYLIWDTQSNAPEKTIPHPPTPFSERRI